MKPKDLRLPDKFEGWREGQKDIVFDLIKSKTRWTMQIAPTGSGKSLAYIAAAVLTGGRTVILTSTKGLQDQIEDEFEGMVSVVKGKQGYRCRIAYTSCAFGPCNWGINCQLKDGGCKYYDAIAMAKRSRIVVTNYAFWLSNEPGTLGHFNLMVCDEAHNSVDAVLDHDSMEITREESERYLPWPSTSSPRGLLEWGKGMLACVEEHTEKMKQDERVWGTSGTKILSLLLRVRKVKEVGDPGEWVIDKDIHKITFDRIWPRGEILFRDTPKIAMISATVNRKTMEHLGVNAEELTVKEYQSHFPISNRLVYYIPTVKMDHRIGNEGMGVWMSRIDQIIRGRKQDKGIIHTVSYDRCKRVMNASEYSDCMITHARGNTSEIVEKFKEGDPPLILVSPSMVTGWDFPHDQCRWQTIGKIGFPDGRSKVMVERGKIDKDYGSQIAAQSLVQAVGRGVRSQDDWCTSIIIDDHFAWFKEKCKGLFPRSFLESVRVSRTIPAVK